MLPFLRRERRDNRRKEQRRLEVEIAALRDEVDLLMKQIDDLHRKEAG